MPLPKGISAAQAGRLRRCEAHLEGKPGVNKYAVCRASVLKKGMKNAIARRLGRKK
jgi:hypothetical protein